MSKHGLHAVRSLGIFTETGLTLNRHPSILRDFTQLVCKVPGRQPEQPCFSLELMLRKSCILNLCNVTVFSLSTSKFNMHILIYYLKCTRDNVNYSTNRHIIPMRGNFHWLQHFFSALFLWGKAGDCPHFDLNAVIKLLPSHVPHSLVGRSYGTVLPKKRKQEGSQRRSRVNQCSPMSPRITRPPYCRIGAGRTLPVTSAMSSFTLIPNSWM